MIPTLNQYVSTNEGTNQSVFGSTFDLEAFGFSNTCKIEFQSPIKTLSIRSLFRMKTHTHTQ